MHVTKNPDGTFTVNDEPLRLSDAAAERLLKDMECRDQQAERQRFLDECDREYRAAQEKKLDK